MKTTNELTVQELRIIVTRLQAVLYLDLKAGSEAWNPETPWSPDTLDRIAQLMAEYDLVPTVIAFAEHTPTA